MILLPTTNQLILFLISVNLVVFLAVVFIFLRIRRAVVKEERILERNGKLMEAITGQVEDLTKTYLHEMVGSSTKRVEHEVEKFSEELARLIHTKSAELSAFVEKAQMDQVKESQFFVANMLAKIEKEAEEYRQNKLKRVDFQIRDIVQSAAREVIGRAISLSEHEDLVVKALERAKKDRIFA